MVSNDFLVDCSRSQDLSKSTALPISEINMHTAESCGIDALHLAATLLDSLLTIAHTLHALLIFGSKAEKNPVSTTTREANKLAMVWFACSTRTEGDGRETSGSPMCKTNGNR
eukprot:11750-Heterococcus_DN1.PRE.2